MSIDAMTDKPNLPLPFDRVLRRDPAAMVDCLEIIRDYVLELRRDTRNAVNALITETGNE